MLVVLADGFKWPASSVCLLRCMHGGDMNLRNSACGHGTNAYDADLRLLQCRVRSQAGQCGGSGL